MSVILSNEFTRFTELRRRLLEADPEIDETTFLATREGAITLSEVDGEVKAHMSSAERLSENLSRFRDRRRRLIEADEGIDQATFIEALE